MRLLILNKEEMHLTADMAGDFCHPTEKGYQIWADEIRPLVTDPLYRN